jgi:hypothetical protein
LVSSTNNVSLLQCSKSHFVTVSPDHNPAFFVPLVNFFFPDFTEDIFLQFWCGSRIIFSPEQEPDRISIMRLRKR